MSEYEYKTVAAPRRAPKVKGVKGKDALAARSIEDVISAECVGGWDYVRSDSFQFEEANGIVGGKHTVTRSIMVFRRKSARAAPAQTTPQQMAAPQMTAEPARASEAPVVGGAERG